VAIAFVVLKLTGVITWSWWWVLSPLWIGAILGVLALCAGVVLLRRAARKQMHEWVDHFGSGDWLRETPDAQGQGKAPGPPDD
jgi:hypothetical protein